MPTLPDGVLQKKERLISAMRTARLPWWNHWKELSDLYLPRRYSWLQSPNERTRLPSKNPKILDGTGTLASRTLASGMMNGITSPSRPWFKLRIIGLEEEEVPHEIQMWLDETQRAMLQIMAESNFYNALAVMYLDLVIFGTAAMLIYEDFDSVIRCYNPALGEYYFGQSDRLEVDRFAREFNYTVDQAVTRWGEENVSDHTRSMFRQGGGNLASEIAIVHLIEPNDGSPGSPNKRFKFREYYWEKSRASSSAPTELNSNKVLEIRGYNERPGIFARWELGASNDAYGSCPAMDAYGDVAQLQHETKKKGQGLDFMVRPPIVADAQLENRPNAILPGGVTFVAGVNNVGAKAVYEVRMPIGELTQDIREVQARIRETFHNDLFRMISQLDTVRSAAEIDARREEKLVLLGPVLERFENEGLDPAISRVFSVGMRKGRLPEPPQSFDALGLDLEVQYVSILATAQRALSTAPTERFLQLVGETMAIAPNVRHVPNFEDLVRNYGKNIGVDASSMNPPERTAELIAADEEKLAQQEAAQTGSNLVEGAKTLSQADVGGGSNALQQLFAQGVS